MSNKAMPENNEHSDKHEDKKAAQRAVWKNTEHSSKPSRTLLYNKKSETDQRKRIREFDRELFSYTGQIAWLLPGIFSFIAMIWIFIPVQELESGDRFMYLQEPIFAIWISIFILQPYLLTKEPFAGSRQKIRRTYDKLKYLPVSKKQYDLVRLGYLFRYTWKLTAVGMFLQCMSAVLLAGYMDIRNVLYTMAALFVTPMLAGWLQIKLYGVKRRA